MKKYKIGFEPWGLLLFLLIMLPNLVWFAVPAPHDVLREESVTPVLDGIASLCQILLTAALCLVVRRERNPLRPSPALLASFGCVLLYFGGWILYYAGIAHPLVLLLLTLLPCLSFFLFALDRKNFVAAVPVAVFTVCHLMHCIVNFML